MNSGKAHSYFFDIADSPVSMFLTPSYKSICNSLLTQFPVL